MNFPTTEIGERPQQSRQEQDRWRMTRASLDWALAVTDTQRAGTAIPDAMVREQVWQTYEEAASLLGDVDLAESDERDEVERRMLALRARLQR